MGAVSAPATYLLMCGVGPEHPDTHPWAAGFVVERRPWSHSDVERELEMLLSRAR